jgi:hypothetical protein
MDQLWSVVTKKTNRAMINERLALLLINGEVDKVSHDPHHTEDFYKCMASFANASLGICQSGQLEKLEPHLNIVKKLYLEGNETVKNGITNIYLYKILDTLDRLPTAKQMAKECLPQELVREINRQHFASGI